MTIYLGGDHNQSRKFAVCNWNAVAGGWLEFIFIMKYTKDRNWWLLWVNLNNLDWCSINWFAKTLKIADQVGICVASVYLHRWPPAPEDWVETWHLRVQYLRQVRFSRTVPFYIISIFKKFFRGSHNTR